MYFKKTQPFHIVNMYQIYLCSLLHKIYWQSWLLKLVYLFTVLQSSYENIHFFVTVKLGLESRVNLASFFEKEYSLYKILMPLRTTMSFFIEVFI